MAKAIDIKAMSALLGLSSAMLSGCNDASAEQRNWAVCVDAQGKRIADAQCQQGAGSAGAHGSWAYYGGGQRVPPVGEQAQGASHAPVPVGSYTTAPAEGVARGGFGATGEGHGGGFGGAGE